LAEERVQRRLAAILAADVVGYSRLMGEDEAGTLAAVTSHISELFEPEITAHHGRIFKTMGDAVFAEFASVVDAVSCAVAFQQGMGERNADTAKEQRIEFRIGVNLGDVIVQEDDVFGDGVNVAARLEGLAEPGGICVSDMVHQGIGSKLDLSFEDLGFQHVKNIAKPIHVYRLLEGHTAAPTNEGIDTDKLFRRPAVAVLPFDNLSGDPEQEYFSDGLSEDVITMLSAWRSFPVIARNSSFAFKGQSRDVREIAKDLVARYVIEGSVRKAGNRIRITAQLIDAETGHHLWADKFDGELADVFAIQDEITQRIVTAVEPEMEKAELNKTAAKRSSNLNAWDYYLRGTSQLYHYTVEGNRKARAMFEEAIALDASYGDAYAGLSRTYQRDIHFEAVDDRTEWEARALEAARQAVNLDSGSSFAHLALSGAYIWSNQHELAIAETRTAVELNPSSVQARLALGNRLDIIGDPERGIPILEEALALSPRDPNSHSYYAQLARANINARNYDRALECIRESLRRKADHPHTYFVLAICLGYLGRIEEAKEAARKCEELHPGFLEKRADWDIYLDPASNRHLLEGLRKVGHLEGLSENDKILPLPDKPSIAVLAFENMSGDPEQEYFSDGITEDIITGLSAFRSLFVIARNSTFTYKGKPMNVTGVARELGVRYVMEGSVRKAGDRVRITAQLIDADDGHHIWAERYDRDLEDIFAVQDEITERVVTTVVPALDQAEQARAARKLPKNLDMWDCYQRGLWHMNRRRLREFRVARRHFQQAIRQAPQSPLGYIGLAYLGAIEAMIAVHGPESEFLKEIEEAARTAVALDELDAMAHVAMGWGKTLRRESSLAIPEFERAVQLNPNLALSYSGLAAALTFVGRVDEGIRAIETALRLSPRDPNRPYWRMTTAAGLFVTERYETALADLDLVQDQEPTWAAALTLRAAILSALGKYCQARALSERVNEIAPNFKPSSAIMVFPFMDDIFLDMLRAALEGADWEWR